MSFDLRTHKRNKKGHITSVSPYRRFVENGVVKYERPKGSGFMYAENGELLSSPKVKDAPMATPLPAHVKQEAQAINALAHEAVPSLDEALAQVATPKRSFLKE